jgi:hypothetical protein
VFTQPEKRRDPLKGYRRENLTRSVREPKQQKDGAAKEEEEEEEGKI